MSTLNEAAEVLGVNYRTVGKHLDSKVLDFEGDFVPLFPIRSAGTPLHSLLVERGVRNYWS